MTRGGSRSWLWSFHYYTSNTKLNLRGSGAEAEFNGRVEGVMTVIAVAGGTGGVGKTIVESLVQEPKYQVVVLSRNVRRSGNIRP